MPEQSPDSPRNIEPKAKHTPAVESCGCTVAPCEVECGREHIVSCPLHQAAPGLADALSNLTARFTVMEESRHLHPIAIGALQKARAALKKAGRLS